MRQPLQRLALAAGRRPLRVFAVFAVLVAASLGAASRLSFDTDMLGLLPRDEPAVETFREFIEHFGGLDLLLVLVRLPAEVPVDPYGAFADELAAELAALEEVEYVEHRTGELEDLLRTFLPRTFLFLDEAGRERAAARLTAPAITARAEELRRLATSPQAVALEPFLVLDPLGLSELFVDQLGGGAQGLAVDVASGYYLSRDHRLLLLLAKPTGPAQDIDFDERLLAAAEGAVDRAAARWGELAPGGELAPPEVAFGGTFVTAMEDAKLIRQDILVGAASSLAGVLLLFLLAFRRLGPLLFAVVPLAAGVVLTFGFAAVTLGSLSSLTSGIAALLIGLAIDFVIVSYGRYVEERRAGARVATAIRRMNGSSGKAVVVGAVTTAATFYAFLVTGFVGLRQMGLLAGTGILLCMVAVLTLLPALLVWRERSHRRRASRPNLYIHAFGTGRLIAASFRHPRTTLAVGALVTAGLGWSALQLEFQDSVEQMRSPHNRGIRVQQEVAEGFGSGFQAMNLVVSGETIDEVLALSATASEGAEALAAEGVIAGYDALSRLVPSPARQRAAIDWLAMRRAPGLTDPQRVEADLSAALTAAGLRPEAFSGGIDLLVAALSVDEPLDLAALSSEPATGRLLERYLRRTDEGWKALVRLLPESERWRRLAPPEVVALAERLGPRVELTGLNVVSASLRGRARHDAVVAALLGLVLVALLLWLDYRRLGDTLLSLAPLLVGVVWMLGAMALLDIEANLLNVFVTTMILGIGVDYGIHAIHRVREGEVGGGDLAAGLQETGKAIALAALSTVVGFGSMSLSRYPGLRSVGLVAILGALATALVSVTLLPAWLSFRGAASEVPLRREEP